MVRLDSIRLTLLFLLLFWCYRNALPAESLFSPCMNSGADVFVCMLVCPLSCLPTFVSRVSSLGGKRTGEGGGRRDECSQSTVYSITKLLRKERAHWSCVSVHLTSFKGTRTLFIRINFTLCRSHLRCCYAHENTHFSIFFGISGVWGSAVPVLVPRKPMGLGGLAASNWGISH